MLTLIWKMRKDALAATEGAAVCAQKDINFYDISCWEWIRNDAGDGWKGKNSYLLPAGSFTTDLVIN